MRWFVVFSFVFSLADVSPVAAYGRGGYGLGRSCHCERYSNPRFAGDYSSRYRKPRPRRVPHAYFNQHYN